MLSLLREDAMTRNDRTTATRTVAYLRVSTDKQADRGVSLDAQRAKVEAYAALYDLELVAVIVDAGASAKTLERDGLSEALRMLRTGEADALLVAKLDRLTRSVRDLDTLIRNYFSDRYALLSVSEQIDTRSAAGRLVLNVLASVSQWEREAIGERTSVALQHKRSRGEYTGGRAPYGWSVGPDGRTLEANEAEQKIVAIAKTLRESGLSLRKVGAALAIDGLLPRSRGQWHAKTVQDLLNARAA
jgi:DNA invertase Pin-like site-specific DNA recombinase